MISISSKIKNAGMYQYYYSGHSDRVRSLIGQENYSKVYNKYQIISNDLRGIREGVLKLIDFTDNKIEFILNA